MQSREVGREDSFAGDLFPISTIPAVPVERIRQALTVAPTVRPHPFADSVRPLRDSAPAIFGPCAIWPARDSACSLFGPLAERPLTRRLPNLTAAELDSG